MQLHRTNWYLTNLDDVGKEIWEIGQAFKQRAQAAAKDRRHTKIPIPLLKAFYIYYLSGMRQQELFMNPWPTLAYERKTMEFVHVNEKHFTKRVNSGRVNRTGKAIYIGNGIHTQVNAVMPINGPYERKMLWYITSGLEEFSASRIFQYDKWKSTKNEAISQLFADNFKASLKAPQDTDPRLNQGITPHILRHARVYDVLINKKLWRNPMMAAKWFGWTGKSGGQEMLYYYADIKRILEREHQKQKLEELGLLEESWEDPALTLS